MRIIQYRLTLFCVFFFGIGCVSIQAEDPPPSRGDQIPSRIKGLDDSYLEGYIQSLLDMHYYEFDLLVKVRNQTVTLYNLPQNELLAKSIHSFVQDFPGIKGVLVQSEEISGASPLKIDNQHIKGIWLPQTTVLFAPLIADPRQVGYSISYRMNDNPFGQKVGAFSFGDQFPIFRWFDMFRWHGDLQLSIEAGIWATYDLVTSSAPLVNADYYVGFPLTYAFDSWSFRLRLYHMSSHLGDEFLVNHPGFTRLNPSIEVIDFVASYQLTEQIRVYGGCGYIAQSDPSYEIDPGYIVYGVEVRLLGNRSYYHGLYGQPFLAIHVKHAQDVSFNLDANYFIGYEWSKLRGVGRKIRVGIEIHDGYAQEGQFAKMRTEFVGFKLSYGF